jgi:16S rRNA (uracil1498-N3)-methyltransferase
MRRRFFVDQFTDDTATMHGEAAHHLGRVLRAEPGQFYELSDGREVRLARIEKVTRDRIEFALLEAIPAHEPKLELILLLSIVKFDAFEWALEKATELGITSVIPLAASRSEKALLAAAGKRAARWQKILLESAQQSRRVRLPTLLPLARPADAFRQHTNDLRIVFSERPDAPPLRKVLASASAGGISLAIGPEGGWTADEIALAQRAEFREASLGRLILRAETAVTAALASINYALSD